MSDFCEVMAWKTMRLEAVYCFSSPLALGKVIYEMCRMVDASDYSPFVRLQ